MRVRTPWTPSLLTQNARKKLQTSVAPAMPCQILKQNCWSGRSNKNKTKLARILGADESTRLRMANSVPNYHQDHFAGKGENSLQHYNLVINLFLCLKPFRFPQRKQQRTRNGKIGENFGVEFEESQRWERGDRWSKDVGRYCSSCIINGQMSSEKCWSGGNTPKIQRSSCFPRWYCKKTILGQTQNSPNKAHQHQWQQQKSWMSSPDCKVAKWK